LRQAQAFAYLFQPTDPPPRTHRSYRASGLVLTSTPAVAVAQIAVIAGRRGERTITRIGLWRWA
jgi:hypothetical protein